MTTKYPTPQETTPGQQLANNRLLITLTVITLSLVFACLIYSNFIVRNAQGSWPPAGVDRMDILTPLVMTVILVLSSGAAIMAVRALKAGQRGPLLTYLYVTMGGGLVYSVWMLAFLARLLTTFNGVYSALFLALWFVHVVHAVAVLLYLGYVTVQVRRGRYSVAEGWFPLEGSTNLWHFVTIVWIVLFVVLYIV